MLHRISLKISVHVEVWAADHVLTEDKSYVMHYIVCKTKIMIRCSGSQAETKLQTSKELLPSCFVHDSHVYPT